MDVRGQPIEIGMLLAGRYRIERVLGRGAMGVVVAATQLGIDRLVAVKLMLGESAGSMEARKRFLREARVAAMLRSAHAGKVLDAGVLESDSPYLVLEFLDGEDLAAVSKRRGPLPVPEAVSLLLQACEAIAEAHALGIVHRDLKPANLFLTTGPGGSPCIKVLDFGISKLGDGDLALTGTGEMLGSPLYMAPEQFGSSRDVDARSDLWALGVILYELLATAPPFCATKLWELCLKVSSEPPVPLQHRRPDVPSGLCAVIMQCLEKDRARRWPSVTAFAAALAPYTPAHATTYIDRIARAQHVAVQPCQVTGRLPRHVLPSEVGFEPYRRTLDAPPLSGSAPLASAATVSPRRGPSISYLSAAIGALLSVITLTLLLVGARLRTTAPVVSAAAAGRAPSAAESAESSVPGSAGVPSSPAEIAAAPLSSSSAAPVIEASPRPTPTVATTVKPAPTSTVVASAAPPQTFKKAPWAGSRR